MTEKQRQYQRDWIAKNREKKREYTRRSLKKLRDKNPQQWAARMQQWRESHPERTLEIQRKAERKRIDERPDEVRAKAHRRRALLVGARGDASTEQVQARVSFYGAICAYCLCAPYEAIDHVIPLSRGGTNWPANLRPACKSCNSSKGDKLLSEWRRA